MLTVFNWPITVALAFVIWGLLWIGQRTVFLYSWLKHLRAIDLATFVTWWSIESMTFQIWHQSILAPILLMFVLWGIGIALYQGFVRETFETRKFWIMWWRVVGLGSFVVMIAMAIFAFVVTK
ncbi:DUF3397 family protein [Weissella cibaria]|uniref:DUF3397 family protein n=1 Tax=Weissella cibaria TaxID=137591 RepID=UPI003B50CE3A